MNDILLNELKIEVTYKCPLACVHCSSDANEENELSIDSEKCLSIIDEAIKMSVTQIAFSGGEPLLWNGIVECVKFANQNNINISIYTSGNCDNPDITFAALSNAGLKKAIFSLYSDKDYEHNRITRKAKSFDNTINSIKIAQKYNIITEVHFVALANNYKKLTNIVKFAKDIGVNRISVLRFVPQGRGTLISDYDTLNESQNIELRNTIITLREEGYDIRTGSPFNVLCLNERPKCMAAQDRMIVAPDLLIYPCDAFKHITARMINDDVEYSDLNKSSLCDCWNKSSYLKTIRQAILSEPNQPCKSCKNYSSCLSGCLAQKFLYYSSLYVNPDPACLNRGGKN